MSVLVQARRLGRWAASAATVFALLGCSATQPASQAPTGAPRLAPSFASSSGGPSQIPNPSATSVLAWRQVPMDPSFTGATIADLSGDLGSLIAVGNVGDSAAAWSSDDGIVWRKELVPGGHAVRLLHVRAVGPDWTVAGSRHGAGPGDHLAFWTSTDGTTWQRAVDSPLLSLPGPVTEVFAIHPPTGELVAIGTTCQLPIPAAAPCASRLVGFATAAARTTWRSVSLPALPTWAMSISVLRLDMHNGLPVALGIACTDSWGNPPCAFFALSATNAGWRLTMGDRETTFAGDTIRPVLAAGDGGQYEVLEVGSAAVWAFDPYAFAARINTLTGTPPRFAMTAPNQWFGLTGGGADLSVVSSPDGLTWTPLRDARWTDSTDLPDITGFALAVPAGSSARAVIAGVLQEPGTPDRSGIWTLDLGNAP